MHNYLVKAGFAVYFVLTLFCVDCDGLNKFFLFNSKFADFKGHKKLVYDKNKDDNQINKVYRRLETKHS